MNLEYKFRVVKHSSEAKYSKIYKSIVVQTFSTNISALDFYFFLDITENKISIKNISTIDGDIVKIFEDVVPIDTPERRYKEKESFAFLMGFFYLKTKDNVENAIISLVDKLNHKSSQNKIFSEKWEDFQEQFQVWFEEKIRPCLLREIELNKMYFS